MGATREYIDKETIKRTLAILVEEVTTKDTANELVDKFLLRRELYHMFSVVRAFDLTCNMNSTILLDKLIKKITETGA